MFFSPLLEFIKRLKLLFNTLAISTTFGARRKLDKNFCTCNVLFVENPIFKNVSLFT